jgi:hypothetical protein
MSKTVTSKAPGASQGGASFANPTIKDGYALVFDALLLESSAVRPALAERIRGRLQLETHDDLRRLIDKARASTLYGDVENLDAYVLGKYRRVRIEVDGRADAFTEPELLLFSKEDERLGSRAVSSSSVGADADARADH